MKQTKKISNLVDIYIFRRLYWWNVFRTIHTNFNSLIYEIEHQILLHFQQHIKTIWPKIPYQTQDIESTKEKRYRFKELSTRSLPETKQKNSFLILRYFNSPCFVELMYFIMIYKHLPFHVKNTRFTKKKHFFVLL